MNNLSIEKYKFYLMEQLVEDYNISQLEAQHIIAKSTINKMLKTSPNFIMHYSIAGLSPALFTFTIKYI